ncbi:putative crocetin glucosyltransferase [Helianthus annuus]|nr:putative crocetin glucosyltransferase [Helianthus annuus]KAJ0463623.1 putative crocetin glucosyltransferase [Helianthus annuus]KAJ0467792.1 putative crocetin glucosyltransferase [Helianthus annuus]KAJ0485102.1 putative crocetin glucosyltransferase [Helianthus annuus]KAJ0655651.1 putative crocetin glucosyltransferase [Helianthus annuus]
MSDQSFGGDLIEASHEYLEWMNTKPKGSIVYISFGTLIVWSKKQKEAMAHGLLESKRPFLWVIKDKDREEEEDEISYMHELKKLGLELIIPWCNQLEVLAHPSLGCFVTHCGWNSTLESMACGVPLLAVPKRSDQTTNAKLIEDLWGAGVRVTTNEEGVVEGEEMKRSIEMVMGGHERGEIVRVNVMKWMGLAREAMKEGGSSYMNLMAFIEEVGSCT